MENMKWCKPTKGVEDELSSDTARLLWRQYGRLLLGVPDLCRVFNYGSKGSFHNALSRGRFRGLRTFMVNGRRYAFIEDVADFIDTRRRTEDR